MKYYLGIDGGGTNTTFLLANERGEVISKYQTSTCHYEQIGFKKFQSVILEGLNKSISQAKITRPEIDAIFAAIPGYGESEAAKNKMRELLSQTFSGISWDCGNDVLAGFAGSLALKSGLNILSGTGSMVYGQYNKKEDRAGGWGHICGDEGSAYWVGKKLLETFTKQADGRLAKTHLYDLVKKELNLSYDFELIDIVVSQWQGKRDKIANLATIVTKAAVIKDSSAITIYHQAAYELALQAKAVIDTLKFTDLNVIPVSWSGGLFKAKEIMLVPLLDELKKIDLRCELCAPVMKPGRGAVLLAKQLTGVVSNEFINKLKQKRVN